MVPRDELSAGAELDSSAVLPRGRELAKRVSAGVFALACLTLAVTLVQLSRDDRAAETDPGPGGATHAGTSSTDQSLETLLAGKPDPGPPYVLPREMADLLAFAGFSPSTGRMAAPLSFRDAQGISGSLEQLRGRVVLIAFWSTTCPPCLLELPELERIADRYEKNDFVVLPICLDETDDGKSRDVAARVAPRLKVYGDSNESARRDYHVQHLPLALLVDRAGRLLGRCSGIARRGNDVDRLLCLCLGVPYSATPEAEEAL